MRLKLQTVALLEGSTLAHRAILAHSAILAHRAMLAHVKAQIADSSTPAFDKSPSNSVSCFDFYSTKVSGCLAGKPNEANAGFFLGNDMH